MEHPESLDFTQLLNNSLATHPARARKQSAFTHVTSRGSLKRPLADTDMLSEIKVRCRARQVREGAVRSPSRRICQVSDVVCVCLKRFSK